MMSGVVIANTLRAVFVKKIKVDLNKPPIEVSVLFMTLQYHIASIISIFYFTLYQPFTIEQISWGFSGGMLRTMG